MQSILTFVLGLLLCVLAIAVREVPHCPRCYSLDVTQDDWLWCHNCASSERVRRDHDRPTWLDVVYGDSRDSGAELHAWR